MSDFENYQVERSPKEKRKRGWELAKILIFALGVIGIIFVGYKARESRVDELMRELERARQIPPGGTLPDGWSRDTEHNTVHYHSPPVGGEVCTKLTRTTFEPPQGMSVEDVGHWCNSAKMNVITFSERKRQSAP